MENNGGSYCSFLTKRKGLLLRIPGRYKNFLLGKGTAIPVNDFPRAAPLAKTAGSVFDH